MKSPPQPPMVIIEKLLKAKTEKQIDKIIKTAWERDSQEFFLGLQYSMDNLYDFIITKAPKYQDDAENEASNYNFSDFFKLINFITKSKNISVEEIMSKVRKDAEMCNPVEWNNFYRLILLKKFHTTLPLDAIIKSLNRLTNPKGHININNKNNNDASEIL